MVREHEDEAVDGGIQRRIVPELLKRLCARGLPRTGRAIQEEDGMARHSGICKLQAICSKDPLLDQLRIPGPVRRRRATMIKHIRLQSGATAGVACNPVRCLLFLKVHGERSSLLSNSRSFHFCCLSKKRPKFTVPCIFVGEPFDVFDEALPFC